MDLGGTGHTSLNVKGSLREHADHLADGVRRHAREPGRGPSLGVQTLCADVQIVPFNNIKGAGVVALLNEGQGQKGLALVIYEAGNTDTLFLATVETRRRRES